MYFYIKKIVFFLCLVFSLLVDSQAIAQAPANKIPITQQDYTNEQVEMADSFRADGKIYVVVAVIALILVGIFIYLVSLDRKIDKLEKLVDRK